MADETKVEEVKPGEPAKTDDFVYKRDSVKTLQQIGKETQERLKKARKAKKKENEEVSSLTQNPEKDDELAPEQDEKPEIKEEVKEEKVDHAALAAKAAEDAARKVSEETKLAFKEEISKILDKDKDIIEKQKEADELIASWDKEQRLPKDYNELIQETMRIADAKYEQKAKVIAKQEQEAKQVIEKEELTKKAELDKNQGEEKLAEFNRQITQDLDEIYAIKELPRPAKLEEINNPETTDAAAKETQKVLTFGVELNQRLVKEGKQPVTSLNKIYFLHYKPYQAANPTTQSVDVPGGNAPVAGAKNTPTGDNLNKVDYKQLHNESWAQTKARLVREFAKRMTG